MSSSGRELTGGAVYGFQAGAIRAWAVESLAVGIPPSTLSYLSNLPQSPQYELLKRQPLFYDIRMQRASEAVVALGGSPLAVVYE